MINARVGHTHNRLGASAHVSLFHVLVAVVIENQDAIYGIVASAMRYVTDLWDPEDVREHPVTPLISWHYLSFRDLAPILYPTTSSQETPTDSA